MLIRIPNFMMSSFDRGNLTCSFSINNTRVEIEYAYFKINIRDKDEISYSWTFDTKGNKEVHVFFRNTEDRRTGHA